MSAKVDKSVRLHRIRLRKYRENVKLKLKTCNCSNFDTPNNISLPLVPSKENHVIVDENNLNEDLTRNIDGAIQNAYEAVDNVSSNDAVKHLLFDTPNVQEMLAKSGLVSHSESSHLQQSHAPIEETGSERLPNMNTSSQAINVVSINCDNLTALGESIVAQMKTYVTEIVDRSEKKILRHVDGKFKELMNIVLWNKNQEITSIVSLDDFKNTYPDMTFPVDDCAKFSEFNTKLLIDYKNIRSNLMKHIQTTTSSSVDAKDNLNVIFKNFISNQVLVSHTAKNSVNAKPTIKDTEFFKVVRDALYGMYNTANTPNEKYLDENMILKAVGAIINSKRSSGNKSTLLEASVGGENA